MLHFWTGKGKINSITENFAGYCIKKGTCITYLKYFMIGIEKKLGAFTGISQIEIEKRPVFKKNQVSQDLFAPLTPTTDFFLYLNV